jgi:hypothetical protein
LVVGGGKAEAERERERSYSKFFPETKERIKELMVILVTRSHMGKDLLYGP